ncbi:MAG: DEAD/DEAH box helicase, partial [Bdellovibrionales bacterium]|nr:DEAD/DEAH box helicase [Bdellovibrionales bacterium]
NSVESAESQGMEAGEESIAIDPDKRVFGGWRKSNYILVLVPTRELAEQVYETVTLFGKTAGLSGTAIYGGMAYEKQKKAISLGVDFIVATPGRLIDLYKEHIIDLRQVRAVVFDEADRMFDMGFKEDMKFILNRIPRDRQMLVFSATLNFDVLNVCYEFGSEPVEINVSKDQPKAENVDDVVMHVGSAEKPSYLLSILKKELPRQAVVFSNYKRNVERIAQFLNKNGIPAVGISSLMTQAQRNRVMAQFKSENERNILVATDLAARGLDVVGVDIVINFELPDDYENYVHRIGRTGRAGEKGRAFSLVCDRDLDALKRIEDYLGHKVELAWLDDNFVISEFSPFPSERELSSYPTRAKHNDNRNSGRARDSRRPSRNSRGGPRRGRGPEGASARYSGTSPKEGAAPHSQQNSERPQSHRDRSMGRHRSSEGASGSRARNSGESTELESKGSYRESRDTRQGKRSRRDRYERSSGGSGKNQGRTENSRRRPHSSGDKGPSQERTSARSEAYKKTRGKGARASSRRVSSQQVVAKNSIGKKVSGFFKKIFGGS